MIFLAELVFKSDRLLVEFSMNYCKRKIVLAILRIFVMAVVITLILFFIFLKMYYGKMDKEKEQAKYLLHVNFLERIAEVMQEKNSFIPLYQIYIDGLLPMQFFTEVYSPEYYEAVYWDTLSLKKGQTEVVPFEIFDRICNVIAQYNDIKKFCICRRGVDAFYRSERNKKELRERSRRR